MNGQPPPGTNYSIIVGEDDRDLARRVNEEMKKGWVPQGGAYINKSGYPAQAVTRRDWALLNETR